jgi:hypothetical protein
MTTKEDRQAILNCTHTNAMYMAASAPGGRPPTAAVEAGYPAVVGIYRRIAREARAVANQWVQDADLELSGPVPAHSAAVDAFWWGVSIWAKDFCSDMVTWWDGMPDAEPGVRQRERKNQLIRAELTRVFVHPHVDFANWLRMRRGRWVDIWSETTVPVISPGQIILDHDARWTLEVIKLTARWGLRRHLKDVPALWQALLLVRKLRQHDNAVARAYLESDLAFLAEIFGHFPLGRRTKTMVDVFLQVAAENLARGFR